MGQLDGKVALITGASRGQGEAEARAFVRNGARVLITDILEPEGNALAAELGERARFTRLDVTSEADWAAAVELAMQAFGRLDILVNNAGTIFSRSIEETTLEMYSSVIDINQVGTFLGMRSVVAPMRAAGGGAIVNISSTCAHKGVPGYVAYTASKFAVRGMTKVAALEFAQYGIRVNSIDPGLIDTNMTRDLPAGFVDAVLPGIPMRRLGTVREIADMVLFLASDASSYCTGSAFVIDGGDLTD
jgi:3alpha(or 20beta)-hydroxysteroid dehydrogenase